MLLENAGAIRIVTAHDWHSSLNAVDTAASLSGADVHLDMEGFSFLTHVGHVCASNLHKLTQAVSAMLAAGLTVRRPAPEYLN